MLCIDRFRFLTVAMYLGMSWLLVIAIKSLCAALPTGALVWLGLGGFFYTGGVAFYAWKSLRFSHMVWHLCVLAGSACHFFAVLFYVLPVSGVSN